MADVFNKRKRSAVMAAIKSRGNRDTEAALAGIFRRRHITGWRRNQPLLGKPDFTFRRERVAVFVDGCFWHGCPRHGRRPDSNVDYWRMKLERNKARDRAVTRGLREAGWMVIRIWEHELRNESRVAARVLAGLSRA